MTERPRFSPEDIVRGLSLPRRVGQVVAGLAALAVATAVGVLWATEPGELPPRTRIAFAGIVGAALAWAGFAGWALIRRPLFAVDRVIGARLAVASTAITTAATITVAAVRGSTAGLLAAATVGLALTVGAGTLLSRAHAYRKNLLERQAQLERQQPEDPT